MLKLKLSSYFKKTFGFEFPLDFSRHLKYGDLSSNVAFTFNKRKNSDSFEKALQIKKLIDSKKYIYRYFDTVKVVKPGFINFFFSDRLLLSVLDEILKKKDLFGTLSLGKGKNVVIDYSSPNIAKSFSVGHLRSTLIGDSLKRLYKFLGYKVIADNHLGDWGTQFGAIIFQIMRKKVKLEDLKIEDLENLYVSFHKEAERNENFKIQSKEWFARLEKGDKKAREIWKRVVSISLEEFERIYKRLGVSFDFYLGESFYEDKMWPLIKYLKNKKILKKSRGALIFKSDDLPPAIVLKSDGATTYFTRDLATIDYRNKRWKPDLIIYEVGKEQSLHFKQLFALARKAGLVSKQCKLVHVPHGLVLFGGKKMSTRMGTTIKLEELLDEAVRRALKVISKKKEVFFEKDEKEKIAERIGISAIKYFDLSHHPSSDIDFSWERVFLLEGNSAPYLQYTYARAYRVFKKSGLEIKNLKIKDLKDFKEEEKRLLRLLVRFPDIVIDSAYAFSPNLLCSYLFSLAQNFNSFYDKHPIIKSNRESLRVAISFAVSQVIKNGLSLLGIEVLEKM